MAIGAATLDVNSSNYCTLRYTTAAAALADNDSFTVGLFGDAGSTVAAPAGWAGNGTTVAGATGQSEAVTDAQRDARTLMFVNYTADPTPAAGVGAAWVLTKGGAPWRATYNFQGTAPIGVVTLEFFIMYLNSMIR